MNARRQSGFDSVSSGAADLRRHATCRSSGAPRHGSATSRCGLGGRQRRAPRPPASRVVTRFIAFIIGKRGRAPNAAISRAPTPRAGGVDRDPRARTSMLSPVDAHRAPHARDAAAVAKRLDRVDVVRQHRAEPRGGQAEREREPIALVGHVVVPERAAGRRQVVGARAPARRTRRATARGRPAAGATRATPCVAVDVRAPGPTQEAPRASPACSASGEASVGITKACGEIELRRDARDTRAARAIDSRMRRMSTVCR